MEQYTQTRAELSEGILTIELSNPRRRNAMNLAMRRELLERLTQAEEDDNVVGVVVTGDGDVAFSAGADINELRERTALSELARPAFLRRELTLTAESLRKPVVAAINGLCLGAGLEFALGCTVRIAASEAMIGLPEILLGVIPGSGGTQRLARVVGLGHALQMILTGEPVDAKRAEQIGLVTEVVAADDLLPRARSLAALMGSRPGVAFATAKEAVLRSLDTDLRTGLEIERYLFAICAGTEDKAEAVDAFLGKREPTFRNR